VLFNSYEFIFIFLPLTFLGFYLLGKFTPHRIAMSWLVLASLFFYGWWNPIYLGLIVGSILFNYLVGLSIDGVGNSSVKKLLFVIGLVGNLGLLAYFKYANFFVSEVISVFDAGIRIDPIVLPLAISFFTFQQIAYLADIFKGKTREHNFIQYCLFVTFFPQLIAGPIVHHREMLPQFARNKIYLLSSENVAVGITIFVIGLFKKVVIADGMSLFSNPIFSAADHGTLITFFGSSPDRVGRLT